MPSKVRPLTKPTDAFQLRLVPAGAAGGQCCEPLCTRAGRYSIQIAGWFVERQGVLGGKDALCRPCAEVQRDLWAELTGETHRVEVTAAIQALAGSKSERVHAIWDLRGLGYSAEEITSVLAAVGEREPIEEILNCLLGKAERVGVAA